MLLLLVVQYYCSLCVWWYVIHIDVIDAIMVMKQRGFRIAWQFS